MGGKHEPQGTAQESQHLFRHPRHFRRRVTAEDRNPLKRMDIDEGIDDQEVVGQYGAMVQEQLALIGEDPSREGLLRTPDRFAKAMQFLTRGYRQRVEDVVGEGIFAEEHRNMIMVRDIELYSLCEHHMLPFFGRAHVAYI